MSCENLDTILSLEHLYEEAIRAQDWDRAATLAHRLAELGHAVEMPVVMDEDGMIDLGGEA